MLSICRKRNKFSKSKYHNLGDDELTEILLKLPLTSVLKFKSVCKRWNSIFSQPLFAQLFLEFNPQHIQLITFNLYDPCYLSQNNFYSLNAPSYQFRFCFSFIPAIKTAREKNQLKYLHVWGVSDWLMLITAGFSPSHDQINYVCNPMTKKWLQLAKTFRPLKSGVLKGFVSYSNKLEMNSQIYKVGFTVVLLKGDFIYQDSFFTIQVLSSEFGNYWRTFRIPKPSGFKWPQNYIVNCNKKSKGYRADDNKLVVVEGLFHWNGDNCIVAYDPFNNPSELSHVINLPLSVGEMEFHMPNGFIISSIRGKLRLSNLPTSEYPWFLVWEHYNKRTWSLIYNISLGHYFSDSKFLCWDQLHGHKAYFMKFRETVYLLDLSSGPIPKTGMYHASLFDLGRHETTTLTPSRFIISQVVSFCISFWPTPLPKLKHHKRFV